MDLKLPFVIFALFVFIIVLLELNTCFTNSFNVSFERRHDNFSLITNTETIFSFGINTSMSLENTGTMNKTQVLTTNNSNTNMTVQSEKFTKSATRDEEIVALQNYNTTSKYKSNLVYVNIKPTQLKREFKIVFYHPFHGGLTNHAKGLDMSKCVYKNCKVTISRTRTIGYIDADAVIFQGQNVPPQVPVHRDANQVFVFLSIETPHYLNFENLAKWGSFYNWTMTYRLDSDIPYIYGYVLPKSNHQNDLATYEMQDSFEKDVNFKEYEKNVYLEPTGIEGKNYTTIWQRKTKTVAWLVSHCPTASKRERYVKKMLKHADIDIFGKCGDNECPKGEKCNKMIVLNYKFYLAFENSLCTDYITEKAFQWFREDIIVVVRGARQYSKILPKGAFIDANDFETAEDLAMYLTALASNQSEYVKFLKRKDSYRLITNSILIQMPYCNLCRRLNNLEYYRNVIPDIYEWWEGKHCTSPKE